MLDAAAIARLVRLELQSQYPGALILEEAAYFGGFADVLVPAHLHALEIKSASDDLRRLRHQSSGLERTFSNVTLVTVPDHADEAEAIIDGNWGLWVVEDRAGLRVDRRRESTGGSPTDVAWMFGALRRIELERIAVANRLPRCGSRASLTRTLLARLGRDECTRLAATILAAPERWIRGSTAPGPVLACAGLTLFDLPCN